MNEHEIEDRFERTRRLLLELADASAGMQATMVKMQILAPSIVAFNKARMEGAPASELPLSLRQFLAVARNGSDHFMRAGQIYRRVADLLEPLVDFMEQSK